MEHLERRGLLGAAGLIGIAAIARTAKAGPLDPPLGPIAPTGRTLDEVYNRIPGTNGSGDGRIAIPGGTTGVVIGQPGSYVLTGDLTASAGPGLTIASGNVTVDLNGYTVSTLSRSVAAIAITAVGASIAVRNGRTSAGLIGVQLGSASGVILERIEIVGPIQYGIFTSTPNARDMIIRDCTITDVGAATTSSDALSLMGGIYLIGPIRPVVMDNTVNRMAYFGSGSPARYGIYVYGPGTSNVLVTGNRLLPGAGTTGTGIQFAPNGNGIARNNSVIGFSTGFANLSSVAGALVLDGGGNISV